VYETENKKDLSDLLKVLMDSAIRIMSGRLFQAVGPAKARLPNSSRVRGTMKWPLDAERRDDLAVDDETGPPSSLTSSSLASLFKAVFPFMLHVTLRTTVGDRHVCSLHESSNWHVNIEDSRQDSSLHQQMPEKNSEYTLARQNNQQGNVEENE